MKQLLRVVALIIFSSSFVHAQTIADLARRERAKRQSAPKAVVVTNESLKARIPDANTDEKPALPTTPAPVVAVVPDTSESTPGGHDEKWWREQFAKIREDNQRLETQVPLLESNFSKANLEFLTRSYDPDGRGKREIDASKTALEQAKSDLAKGQEMLALLEEQLRRAGGPAGWAR